MRTLPPDHRNLKSAHQDFIDDAMLVDAADGFGPWIVIPVAVFLVVSWGWRLCAWMVRVSPRIDYRAWLGGGFA